MCGNQETATCHLSDWQQKGELIMNMLTASGGESSPWGQHGDLELSRAQREDQAWGIGLRKFLGISSIGRDAAHLCNQGFTPFIPSTLTRSP